jgi:hypothetical protein
MTITTEEAEWLADWIEEEGGLSFKAAGLRSLAAERDALRVEVERLKAGGCARDQGTTQFCAEAVALQAENARLREALREVRNKARTGRPPFMSTKTDYFQIASAALGETQ